MKTITITTEYITLGQFLKFIGIVPSGAHAKSYLSEEIVYVNGEKESRRGRKLHVADVIRVENKEYILENNLENE